MEPEAETAAPRDLLRQFSGINDPPSAPEEISGEVELSLGLSLGGRIFRSSSISCLPMVSFDREEMLVSPLARTSSLPTETEEARRKRKEMQSVKRMEAKRKRSEKRIEVGVGEYTRRPVGSHDGSCSGASDLQTRQIQASDVPGAGTSQQPMVGLVGHSSITGREIMEEMPSVSTMGEGPNGRRIEGFLYRYRKGEEVRIVCVCHGSFLTPAEFVRHAGGGDVDHPLRHIVVNHKSPGLV